MKLAELFLEQLEKEAVSSRRALERVPEGRNDWKPHPKSMALGYLASLVASMPSWVELMVKQDQLDLGAPESGNFRPKIAESRKELLAMLDAAMDKARAALKDATDEHLMTPWSFAMGGRVLSEGKKYEMIRDAMLSHLAHHRGQLTVYLRLNDAAVPAIYGPSADEAVM